MDWIKDITTGSAGQIIAGIVVFFAIVVSFLRALPTYVRKLSQTYSFREFALDKDTEYYDRREFGDLRTLIRAHPILIVTGEAGVGKTSFILNRLEGYCSQSTWGILLSGKIPIIVKATTLLDCDKRSSHDTLVEAVCAGLRASVMVEPESARVIFAHALVRGGRCIFIVDDIDQMDGASTQKLAQVLSDVVPRSSLRLVSNRFVLGCRGTYYRQRLEERWRHEGLDASVTHVELKPLKETEIGEFAGRIVLTLMNTGLPGPASKFKDLLGYPEVANLCRQPFYLALILNLVKARVDIDPQHVTQYRLIEQAAESLFFHDLRKLTDDGTAVTSRDCRHWIFRVVGCIAYKGVLPGAIQGFSFQEEIRNATAGQDSEGCHRDPVALEQLIVHSGVVTQRRDEGTSLVRLGFSHQLFKDYFLSCYCRDNAEVLLEYIGSDDARGRHLVPFWSASSEPRALSKFVAIAKSRFPVLVALCLQQPDRIPKELREELAETAQLYTRPDTYNSAVAERYCAFLCRERRSAIGQGRFRQVLDQIHGNLDSAPTKAGHILREIGVDLYRCMVTGMVSSMDDEAVGSIVAIAVKHKDLRDYGSLAPELFLKGLRKIMVQSAATARGSLLNDMSGPSERDILDAIIKIGTPPAFEFVGGLLGDRHLCGLAAAALGAAFGVNEECRKGFEARRFGEKLDRKAEREYAWLWRPFLSQEPSEILGANTTLLVRVWLENLDQRCMAGRALPSSFGVGLLAITGGQELYQAFASYPLLPRDIQSSVRSWYAADQDEKGKLREELLKLLKPVAPEFSRLGRHLSGVALMAVAWRVSRLDEQPHPDLWGEHVISGRTRSLRESREYSRIRLVNNLGCVLGLLLLTFAVIHGKDWRWAGISGFYLSVGWLTFARDPEKLSDKLYGSWSGWPRIFEFPVVNIPYRIATIAKNIVQLLLSSVEAVTKRSLVPQSWLDRLPHIIVWVFAVGLAIGFGLYSVVDSHLAVDTAIVLVSAGFGFQAQQFFQAWRNLISSGTGLSRLITETGEVDVFG